MGSLMQIKTTLKEAVYRQRLYYPAKQDYLLLILILWLAAYLRFTGLNQPGFWLDELSYTLAAQKPVLNQIINSTETLGDYLSVDPTLSAIPFSLFLKLGDSNFLARFPAALFGVLGVALTYRLGRRLLGNTTGLLAAFLLATSSFHILYSQEARSYTQFIFFSLASFFFFYRVIWQHSLTGWLRYALSTWAAVSTNHLMLFVIGVQGFFLILISALALLNPKPGEIKRHRKLWSYFLASLLIIFLFRLPWLEDFTQRQCAGCAVGRPSYPLDLAGSFLAAAGAFTASGPGAIIFSLILILFSLVLLLAYRPKPGVLLTCWLLLAIPVTALGLWFISQFFHPRYTIWALPAFFITLGFGLATLSSLIPRLILAGQRAPNLPMKRVELAILSLLLIPLLLVNAGQIRQHEILKQSRPRGMLEDAARLIGANAAPTDTVVVIGLPAKHLQFYLEPTRPDIRYLDDKIFVEQNAGLPPTLAGRWYVIHNAYAPPRIPQTWSGAFHYHEFHDIVVVYQANPCQMTGCISETKLLLSEIAQANPGSALEQVVNNIMAGLAQLNY
jgi:uncharacterized membrane protein